MVARPGRAQPREPATRAGAAPGRTRTRRSARALLAQRVRFLLLQGRFREVCEAAPEALEAAERARARTRASGCSTASAARCSRSATSEGARARLDESIEVARATGTSDDLATAYLNYADALHIAGQSRGAGGRRARARGGQQARRRRGRAARCAGSGSTWPRSSSTSATGTAADEQLRRRAPCIAAWRSPTRTAPGPAGARPRREHDAARDVLEHAEELLRERARAAVHRAARGPAGRAGARGGDLDGRWPRSTAGSTGSSSAARTRLGWRMVAAAGASVAADAAERARDLGDADAGAAAVARARRLLELIRAAAEDGERPVESAAAGALARPSSRRARGEDDPALWAAAAARLGSGRAALHGAIARWRQAQAELAGADRAAAARDARRRDRARGRARAPVARGRGEGLRDARAADAHRGRADDGRDGDASAEPEPFGLTPRERQVSGCWRSGRPTARSPSSCSWRRRRPASTFRGSSTKLDVRSRTEAAAVAHRHGLASEPPTLAEPG